MVSHEQRQKCFGRKPCKRLKKPSVIYFKWYYNPLGCLRTYSAENKTAKFKRVAHSIGSYLCKTERYKV